MPGTLFHAHACNMSFGETKLHMTSTPVSGIGGKHISTVTQNLLISSSPKGQDGPNIPPLFYSRAKRRKEILH